MSNSASSDNGLKGSIRELCALVLKVSHDDLPEHMVSKAMRLVRPTNLHTVNDHAFAVKRNIRQSLLTQYNNAGDGLGPTQVAKFDRECDALRQLNKSMINPFLLLLEPLIFSNLHMNQSSELATKMNYINLKPKQFEYCPPQAFFDDKAPDPQGKAVNSSPAGFTIPLTVTESEQLQSGMFWICYDIEYKLLRDLLYIFQNINGRYLKYDHRSERFIVDPSLNLCQSARDIVFCLCETGFLYAKVIAYIEKIETSEGKGLIAQACAYALQEELHDYYRLLAVLEQELFRISKSDPRIQDIHHSDMDIESDDRKMTRSLESKAVYSSVEDVPSGLTILRLRAWMEEPLDRLCLMARLVEGASSLSGGALASRLHGHGKHGDSSMSTFVARIMDHVCVPFYNILTRWILYGELQDPYEEFFVGLQNPSATRLQSFSMWQDKYFLRKSMLPSFLSLALAHRVMVIGKTINYIRICLAKLPKQNSHSVKAVSSSGVTKRATKKPSKFIGYKEKKKTMKELLSMSDHTNDNNNNGVGIHMMNSDDIDEWLNAGRAGDSIEDTLQSLRYGGEEPLAEAVSRIARVTDQRLLQLMEDRFYLSEHLLALKKFLLLGQGDFVTCLMDSVGLELKKRANQLYRHNLTGMLEGALRASNAQFEPAFVLDRIGVRLLEASPGDSGWEVFSLDYAIDTPLNAVVHPESISKYRTAFHMLWRLKRVEWSLAASWKLMTTFSHGNRGSACLPKLKSIVHRCSLSRAQMVHAVNNLCAFIMFEVLETAWATFHSRLSSARCIDEVIIAHDEYLDEILDRALLSVQHEALNLQIQQVLQSILKFCTLEENLLADAATTQAHRRSQAISVEEGHRRGIGSWSSTVSLDPPGSVDGVPQYAVTRLEEAAADFTRRFELLMSQLKLQQGDQATDFVKHLTFRLDFNEYNITVSAN